MLDERSATWKVYLSDESFKRVLTIDVETGVLAGLSRSSGIIECLVNSEYQDTNDIGVSTKIHVQPSLGALSGQYTLIVFGGDVFDYGIMACLTEKHCCNNTVLVFLNTTYKKTVNKYLHNYGFVVFKTIAKLPENKPRIYIPIESKDIVKKGLGFHKPGRLLGRIALKCLRLFVSFGMYFPLNRNPILFASKIDVQNPMVGSSYQSWIEKIIGYSLSSVVAYAGSDSARRKLTLLAVSGDMSRPDIVVKVGDTKEGKAAIRQETRALVTLADTELAGQVPELIFEDKYTDCSLLQGQSVYLNNCNQVSNLTDAHIKVLTTLTKINPVIAKISDSNPWKTITKYIRGKLDVTTPIQSIHSLLEIKVLNGASALFHFVHGDFAPWNITACDNSIFVYDWEDSRSDGLLGSDLFYYFYSQAHLIGPWPGADKLHKQLTTNFYRMDVKLPAEFNLDLVLGIWLLDEFSNKPTDHLVELADVILRKFKT
jgi:hypothetical protein